MLTAFNVFTPRLISFTDQLLAFIIVLIRFLDRSIIVDTAIYVKLFNHVLNPTFFKELFNQPHFWGIVSEEHSNVHQMRQSQSFGITTFPKGYLSWCPFLPNALVYFLHIVFQIFMYITIRFPNRQ